MQKFDCVILNGLCQWGFDSSYTFISSSGCSTIDYVLISSDLCSGDFVQSFKVFPCIESNHLPHGIVLKMHTASSVNSDRKENPKPTWISKLIGDKTKETDFLANFNSDIIRDMCARAVALIDHNTDQTLELFTSSLLRASECMKKTYANGKQTQRFFMV